LQGLEIVAGDNVNDLDIIKEFKSHAMENGVDMIKKVANYTAPGVVELIERELLVNR
jgi:hydroxymethylpyrimidine pyrophosphatase-like HAD family hydrolase